MHVDENEEKRERMKVWGYCVSTRERVELKKEEGIVNDAEVNE